MTEQERLEKFQQLVREAETTTGITVVSRINIVLPGGVPMTTPQFELGNGLVAAAVLTLQTIENWTEPE